MPQKIHYQDDLFLLAAEVGHLARGLSLDANPDFFAARFRDTVGFVDATIRKLHVLIVKNIHLIDRLELAKLLEGVERDFARALEAAPRSLLAEPELYASNKERDEALEGLAAMRQSQLSLAEELVDLRRSAVGEESDADLVSQDELSELLRS